MPAASLPLARDPTGRLTGSVRLTVGRVQNTGPVAQSGLQQESGLQYEVQVEADDCNLNVYLTVRADGQSIPTGAPVTHIVADADVQISVVDQKTDAELMTRSGRLAKPSGGRFRDYMATFNRIAVQSETGNSDSVCFKVEFGLRVVPVRTEDPQPVDHYAHDCKHRNPDHCSFNPTRIMRLTGVNVCDQEHDVTLVAGQFGKKSVNVLKSIVKLRSSYFQSLFFKSDSQQVRTVILPVTWKSLMTFVRYSYTAEIAFTPDQLPDLIRDAVSLMYYDILFAIGATVTAGNVYQVRSLAAEESEQSLVDMCDQFIEENIAHFFKRHNFVHLTAQAIRDLLLRDQLPVSEKQVWDLCQDWLQQQQVGWNGGPLSRKETRKLMLPFLHQIRFAAMGLNQFVAGPLQSHVLTEIEIADILTCLVLGNRCHIFYDQPRFKREQDGDHSSSGHEDSENQPPLLTPPVKKKMKKKAITGQAVKSGPSSGSPVSQEVMSSCKQKQKTSSPPRPQTPNIPVTTAARRTSRRPSSSAARYSP